MMIVGSSTWCSSAKRENITFSCFTRMSIVSLVSLEQQRSNAHSNIAKTLTPTLENRYSAYSPLSKSLYVARSDGDVTALDLRSRTWCLLSLSLSLSLSRTHTITHTNTGTKKIWNLELHDKKVQTVSCSPVSSHYMVTASLDRSIRLWDLRKCAKAKKSCKAVWTYNDSRSVNCAFFDNSTGSSIVSVSQSDQVRLFSDPTSALSGDHVRPTHSVRHNNQTGRYLTVRLFFLHPSQRLPILTINDRCFTHAGNPTPQTLLSWVVCHNPDV